MKRDEPCEGMKMKREGNAWLYGWDEISYIAVRQIGHGFTSLLWSPGDGVAFIYIGPPNNGSINIIGNQRLKGSPKLEIEKYPSDSTIKRLLEPMKWSGVNVVLLSEPDGRGVRG